MRNLILILVLSLTALASTSAVGMSLDHPGDVASGEMASMEGHDCAACPDTEPGDLADHGTCGDCAACNVVGRDGLPLMFRPVAMAFSRVVNLRVTPRPTGRVDTDDPPPPRA